MTKVQPFRLRNDKEMWRRIDVHTVGMTATPLYHYFKKYIMMLSQQCLSQLIDVAALLDMETVTLNNGAQMPTIGMGTWHHGPRDEIMGALK